MKRIEPNAHVTLDYVLRDEDGELLDASAEAGGEPIRYVHGYGMLVPGLEARLVGLVAGDARVLDVPPEEGFGEYDDELLVEVERAELPDPDKVSVGDELVAESADGDEVPMRVVEIRADHVLVDANHPLAGMTLRYEVTVREVRVATDEELARAASELEAAEGEAGEAPVAPTGEGAPDVSGLGLVRPKKPLPNGGDAA